MVMRSAIVDHILLWIVLFVAFVTIFFMVLDYSIVIKAKENCASISNFAARVVAIEGIDDNDDDDKVIARVNSIKGDYFADATTADLVCTDLGTTNYQIIFNTQLTLTNRFLPDSTVSESVGVYNENSSADISCTLTLHK